MRKKYGKKLGVIVLIMALVLLSLPVNAFAATVTIPKPVSLTVNPTNVSMNVGDVKPFQATVIFSNGSTIDASRNAVFIISNTRVVTVKNGSLVALNPGSATVTIRSYGLTGKISVTVTKQPAAQNSVKKVVQPSAGSTFSPPKPVSLVVNPTNVTSKVGEVKPFQATVTFSDGSTVDASRNAVFTISNARVVTVKDGALVALNPGSATITIRSYGLTGKISVTVTNQPTAQNTVKPVVQPSAETVFSPPKPVSLVVNPTNVTLKVGEVKPFQATVTFSNGSTVDASRNAVFTISNARVVTVKNGSLVALNPGSATVTINSYGLVGRINVSVVITGAVSPGRGPQAGKPVTAVPVPVALEVSPSSVTLEQGQSVPVKIVVKYSDGSVKDITSLFSYNAVHARLANGVITGVAPGEGTFSLTYENLRATLTVKVQLKPIAVNIKPPSLEPALGAEKKTLTWDHNGSRTINVAVPRDLLRWDREVQQLAEKFYRSDGYTQQAMLAGMSTELKTLVLAPADSHGYNVTPWVNDPYNLLYLREVVNALKDMASGMNRYDAAQLALSMVQSLPYHVVNPPQMASQTLIEGGDCDAKSVLLASLLKLMGYDVALLYYDRGTMGSATGHMQVGIALDDKELPGGGGYKYILYGGKKYYIMEGTVKGWKIGESPVSVPPRAVYPVN